MEVCVHHNKSAYLDISSHTGSAIDPCNSVQCSSGELSMNDLKACLTELVKIEDSKILTGGLDLSTKKNEIDKGVRECQYSDSDTIPLNDSASDKCLSNCATFPPPSGSKSSEDVIRSDNGKHEEDLTAEVSELNGSSQPSNQCFPQTISLPIPSKLVSALKGSRERQGIPPKKLSVSWAPDVYDPIPTSVSHVPSNKNQCSISYGKKYGKHKQKGRSKSSSQSSGRGKEKKHGRKNGRSVGKLIPFHDICEVQAGSVDFDLGSPDLFCGSSFLKASVGKLHFPIAEAS